MKRSFHLDSPSDELVEKLAETAAALDGEPCITSTFECNGGTRSVTTCKYADETVADWLARHQAEVKEAMKDCK